MCKAEWKEPMPLADVRHGALPLPTYKMVAHDPSVEFHLLRVGLARGGGMLEHEEQVLPTDVRADMERKFAVFSQQKAAAAKDAGSGGSSASELLAHGGRRALRTTLVGLSCGKRPWVQHTMPPHPVLPVVPGTRRSRHLIWRSRAGGRIWRRRRRVRRRARTRLIFRRAT